MRHFALPGKNVVFGNSQGEVEGQHFYQATQNGARTAIVFAHQPKTHIKELWILILEYNNSLRAPRKRCTKVEPKSKHGSKQS